MTDTVTNTSVPTKIRHFRPEDNAELQAIEVQCAQGDPQTASWYAVFDDFTLRARKYEHHDILVLEDVSTSKAIGTAAVGIKELRWISNDGSSPTIATVGHCFNLRMHPAYRGKRLSRPLVEERKRLAKEAGCTHIYATIAPSNNPSLALFRPSTILVAEGFAANLPLPPMVDQGGTGNELTFQLVEPPKALELMTKYHGNKLFFPQDMDNLLSSKHCFGSWIATCNRTNSLAFFSLWDSSSAFQWQMIVKGQELPLTNIVNIFGIAVEGGDLGIFCLDALIRHISVQPILRNHHRIHAFLSSDELSETLRAKSSASGCGEPCFALEHMTPVSVCVAPTEGDPSQDTRFEAISGNQFFCDPRDY